MIGRVIITILILFSTHFILLLYFENSEFVHLGSFERDEGISKLSLDGAYQLMRQQKNREIERTSKGLLKKRTNARISKGGIKKLRTASEKFSFGVSFEITHLNFSSFSVLWCHPMPASRGSIC